jgi:hypothetical protein
VYTKWLVVNNVFSFCRDDPELNNMLKDRLRFGDPMAHLVKASNLLAYF